MKEVNNIFKEKFVPVLEHWITIYKLVGSPSETPRYSQVRALRGEDVKMVSTQKQLEYVVELTEEEKELLYEETVDGSLWNLWREFRTNYLVENHPTIDPY